MNFFRKLLFPFSLLYGTITALRNLFYDWNWLKSKRYDFPVICVGNLSTGGTGKSPMIEFLVSFLKENNTIAVLSRGYKRKSSGYREVLVSSSVEEVGDEPLQFKKKYPEIMVAVCEDRQTGIEVLEKKAAMVLLDDAFQHRKVDASLNILLTPYDLLYSDDCLLPAGNLREPKMGAKRAGIVIVTKCPDFLDASEKEKIKQKLNLRSHQSLYFTKIGYSSEIKSFEGSKPLDNLIGKDFLLITGIANPKPMVQFLREKGFQFSEKRFPDHHNFSNNEIEMLKKHPVLLTTEKDFMRLQHIGETAEIYYLPIKTVFLNGKEADFKADVLSKISGQ